MKRLFAWWIALLVAILPGAALAATADASPVAAVASAQSPAAVLNTTQSVDAFQGASNDREVSTAAAAMTSANGSEARTVALRTSGYRSGYRAPSPGVGTTRTYGSTYGSVGGSGVYAATRPSFGSHLFSFGAGWLLGSMFHPFGYYGMGVYHPFSLFGLILDIVLLVLLWKLVRWMFFRR
ncbi:hypothetical protein [Alicyclobacillus sp.]|uniref:hypothetical protein n=1 Tax=Alicyclobacillus sp. TaxID=61169 RepID=UPI0025C2041A|nr:hypothetical protein [Alicyclobacillus sp.]MCL6517535.1 hypothetical protein [Alicyclobacillus sp.]